MTRRTLPYVAILVLAAVWAGLVNLRIRNDHKDHFVAYCQERATVSSAMYRTIHELLKIARTTDCERAFATLNALPEISLNSRNISQLEPLRGLNRLRKLTLMQNQIRDLSPISSMTDLEELDISFNKITSLSALNGLKLKILAASDNPLADVQGLHELPELLLIDISAAQLTELPNIKKMGKLKELIAVNNRIGTIGIDKLHSASLKLLKLDHNHISDLNFLKNLPQLVELSINANHIKDLAGLPPGSKIKALGLASNHITDIKAIFNLPEIVVVDVKSNRIGAFDVPLYHGKLRKLDLRFNNIEGDLCKNNSLTALCKTIVI